MPRRLRILHVFGRLTHGGAELRTLDVVRNSDRQRFDFDFVSLTGQPGPLDAVAQELGCGVHLLAMRSGFAWRFCRLLRERRIDIVQSHVHHASGYLLQLARLAGVPGRICHYRISGDCRPKTLARRIQQSGLKQLVGWHANQIVGVSRSTLDLAWSHSWTSDPRCKVIYNGLDLGRFDTSPDVDAVRSEFQLASRDRLAIHVASFRPEKNHGKLLRIFCELRRRDAAWRLLLVGGGRPADAERIRSDIARHGLEASIRFAGVRDDLPRLLQASDLMLFPSLHEGLPGAVLEAAATGLPVIGSRLPTICEVEEHFPGVRTVDLQADDGVWADCAERELGDRGDRNCKAALERFRRSAFTIEECVQRHAALWEEAAGRPLHQVGSAA